MSEKMKQLLEKHQMALSMAKDKKSSLTRAIIHAFPEYKESDLSSFSNKGLTHMLKTLIKIKP